LMRSLSGGTGSGLELVRQYRVGLATVSIVRAGGRYRYIVEEPVVPAPVFQAIGALEEYLSRKETVSDDDIWEAAEVLGLVDTVDKYFSVIKYYLMRGRRYGKLDVLFSDELVEEIKIRRGPVYIVHREVYDAEWIETNIVIDTVEELRKYLFLIARRAGHSALLFHCRSSGCRRDTVFSRYMVTCPGCRRRR